MKQKLLILLFFATGNLFAQNPLLLKDVFPGTASSNAQWITRTSGYTFFNAEDEDADTDRGLYRTDGTPAGTIKLNLSYPGFISTKAEKLTAFGNKIVFAGDNFAPGYGEVWVSDGTQAGTIALERFMPSVSNRGPVYEFVQMGSYMYYAVVANNNKTQLRRTDGTPGGTSLVYEFSSFAKPVEFALSKTINGVLYFNIYDTDGDGNDMLWRSDGTAAGTYLLRDFGTEYFAMANYMPIGNKFMFMTGKFDNVNFANSKSTLFISDGTVAGTVPMLDLNGTYNNNLYPSFAYLNNQLYLALHDGINGKELWKTDGTAAGTVLVADISPGATNGNLANLTSIGNTLFFTASTSDGNELWKFDGTTASEVKDINPGAASSSPVLFNESNGKLVFRANTAASGAELWQSDGTTINTVQLTDLNPGTAGSGPTVISGGNKIIFAATNAARGNEIYSFDNSKFVPNAYYVNDNSQAGDVFTGAVGNDANPGTVWAPFATITQAIAMAPANSIIMVDAGTYTESIVVNKPLEIRGVQYGQHPLSSLNRGVETIINPSSSLTGANDAVIKIAADHVTIDGLLIDGDNPSLSGGIQLNGADINAGSGIFNAPNIVNYLTVTNCIVRNTGTNGIGLSGNATTAITGGRFSYNRLDNIVSRALVLANNAYGFMEGNQVSRADIGILISNSTLSNPDGTNIEVKQNIINAITLGSRVQVVRASAPKVIFYENEIAITGPGNGINIVGGPTGSSSGVVAVANKITGGFSSVVTNLTNASSPIQFVNNSLTGYSDYAFETYNGQQVIGTCNWFGTANAQAIAGKILGNVVYGPWLTTGVDADPATGFQNGNNSCNGSAPAVQTDELKNVSCYGASNGNISISISGGSAPYQYQWTLDGVASFNETTQDISQLVPGNYHVTVTDANGSVASQSFTIVEPNLLNALASGENNQCFGANNGTASVAVSGGTSPYAYAWNNGSTSAGINNLPASIYNVVVTDANGCTASAQYEVTQPTQLLAAATGVSTACSNSATVTATGGTGNYSYAWSNGATTASITNIAAGNYSVTVTDANGCTALANVSVVGSEAFNPSAQVVNVSCNGTANGSISITNANGVAPFHYSIDGGLSFQNNNVFSGLAAGTYTVTVVDANGCTGFVSKTITEPAALLVTLNAVQPTCFNAANGSINITATGGTGGYNYLWSGPLGYSSTQKNPGNLAAGNYSLSLTDNNGCATQLAATVTNFPGVTVNSILTNISCKGAANGAINISATDGTGAGFNYSWNTGQVTNAISNLAPGNYTVSITDIGSGCVITRSFTITQPASAIGLTTTKTNATGCASLGTISAVGSGGTAPYQYKLDNDNYQPSGNFSNLGGGNYTVWVKDANNCSLSKLVSITDNGTDEYESNNSKNQAKSINIGSPVYARIALSTDLADWFKFVTPVGNGTYTITLSHPNASFTYNVYPSTNNAPALTPSSATGNTKTYLLNGNNTYYISITGGLSYDCYTLNVAALPFSKMNASDGAEQAKAQPVVSGNMTSIAYPNPHKGTVHILINSPLEETAVVQLYNAQGQMLAEKSLLLSKGNNNRVSFQGLPAGNIFYRVIAGKSGSSGKITGW